MDYKSIMKNLIRFLIIVTIFIFFGCAHHLSEEFKNAALKLNTPQLINEYQQNFFSYATTFDGYGCGGVDISYSTAGCSPSYIFHYRKGNCVAYTKFSVYCLRQAGYEDLP